MKSAALVVHDKVVYQSAIGGKGLRSHACRSRQKIVGAQVWHIALERLEESSFAEVPIHFRESNQPVLESEFTKTAKVQRFPEFSRVDIEAMISFTGKCQNGVSESHRLVT